MCQNSIKKAEFHILIGFTYIYLYFFVLKVPSLDPPIQVSQYQVQSEIVEAQKPQMAPPSYNNMSQQQYVVPAPVPTYPSVISKNNVKTSKSMPSRSNMVYSKSMDNIYPTYSQQNRSDQVVDRIISKLLTFIYTFKKYYVIN